MNLLAELRRRSVFRVAAAYLISGWAVMQVVALIAGASGLPDWTTSFVLMLLIAGLPIALIVAWAFEVTPEGVKQTETGEGTASVRPFSITDGVLLAGLAVVIGVVAWQQIAPSAAPTGVMQETVVENSGPDAASIAVLAFADLSPEGDQEYFSDGISEELLNVLVRVDGLQVASRTSAFRFKGSNASIPEIAAQLNVRHVVEGSVRRAGETIRVTAQLIDSTNDRHLWSETYDRDLSTQSIFEIQDEIATAIVIALSEELDTFLPTAEIEVEAATTNLTAYELYLQARQRFLAREDLEEANTDLARAVELDPEFSEAWEMRAAIHLLNSLGERGNAEYESSWSLALHRDLAAEYADRALALDANSSLAVTVTTFLRHRLFSDSEEDKVEAVTLQRAIDGYERALEIDPHNATALNWRGVSFNYVGYLEEARADFSRCIELEPLYVPCYNNLMGMDAAMGNDELAMEAAVAAWNNGVSFTSPLGVLARLGRRELFLSLVADAYGPDVPWGDNDILYEMYRNPEGDFDHLIPAIVQWTADEGLQGLPYPTPDVIIGNYSALPSFSFGIWEPEMAGFRASEYFQEYLNVGPIPDFWRAYGFPPHCRERDDGWIECD